MIMMVVPIVIVMVLLGVIMLVGMLVRSLLMVFAMGLMRGRFVVAMLAFRRMPFERLRLRRGALDDLAADAVAMTAAPRIAVA
jgi:hypothetical protein